MKPYNTMIGAVMGTLMSATISFAQSAPGPQPELSMTETHPSLRRLNIGTVVFGIGIKASKVEGGVRIDALMLNGPALKAGMKKGDVITEIDGKAARDYTLRENLELIAHTRTYEVKLSYKKAGRGDDIELKLDKNFVTPDRQYVEQAPPPVPMPTPPRVAYYTVTEPNARLRIVAHPKSSFTNLLKEQSCVFVHTEENFGPGFLKISGETADGQRFTGFVDTRAVKNGKPKASRLRCLGMLLR